MKVDFQIHGYEQLVDGVLDLGETPVPAVGWEMYFDAAGWYRVFEIQGFYSALGEQRVTLNLAIEGEVTASADWIVEFVRINNDRTPFSRVELGSYCRCQHCPRR